MIDEKIEVIGTPEEYVDTKSKPLADKLEGKFRKWLIIAIIGIIAMPILILISTLFMKGNEMSKSKTTQKVDEVEKIVIDTKTKDDNKVVIDTKTKDDNLEKSTGGRLPGFFHRVTPA